MTAHTTDHERLAKAEALWTADGRPGFHIKNDRGGVKRAHRRTLGLRLNAHLAMHHGGATISEVHRGAVARNFAEALEWHLGQHEEGR